MGKQVLSSGAFSKTYIDSLDAGDLYVGKIWSRGDGVKFGGDVVINGGLEIETLNGYEVPESVSENPGQVLTATAGHGVRALHPGTAELLANSYNRIMMPLYVYPDSLGGGTTYADAGAAMLALDGRVDVVINPNNGQDAVNPPNSDWVRDLGLMETAAGASWSTDNVFGYVASGFGFGVDGEGETTFEDLRTARLARLTDEINGYVDNNWGVTGGIFVDEVSNNPLHLEYYQDIVTAIKSRGLKVVLNPGVALYEELATNPAVDMVVTLENTYADYGTFVAARAQLEGRVLGPVGIINTAGGALTRDNIRDIVVGLRPKGFKWFYVVPAGNYNSISQYTADLVAVLQEQI